MFAGILLTVGVAASAGIGLFVYARNPERTINKLYALLTLLLVIFSITNYLSLETNNRLFYIRAVIACSSGIVATLYYLVTLLSKPSGRLTLRQRLGIYLTVTVVVLNFTPLVFKGLTTGTNPTPLPNVGAILFFGQLVGFLAASFALLIKLVRTTKGVERLQYIYILYGISPMFFFAPITGFVLAVLFKDAAFAALNPLYALIFIGLIGYAIIRHKLFDVRFFVARATAYLTTLAVMTFILVLPIVLVFAHFLHVHPNKAQLGVVVFTGAALVYVVQYLRQIFDDFTARVFFRHYYDPQVFLEHLSAILVRTIDIDELRAATANHLKMSFEASFVEYRLFDSQDKAERHMATLLRKYAGSNVVMGEVLDNINDEVKVLFNDHNIALAIRIRTTNDDLGFLLFGHRRSGSIYAARDVRVLATASSSIAISLQNALRFKEIEQFNETLKEKIDNATRKLRATNERLRLLDATKDDFISMASHQLRTPLTSVKGYLSLVLDGDAGPVRQAQRKLLSQAFISSQRMVFLIADLLNVSRLKTGKFIIETAPVNLADVVDEEVRQLLETAAGRSLKLTFHKPAHFPSLMLDETKTRQVVMNFIDNAIYYTPAGGQIEVNLLETPKTIELRVVDNGIGVPQAEQYHLFSKFYRAKNAQKARPDGTGLGLFMAKKVIMGQGGAIIFSSQEGRGSTFGFSIPKTKLAPTQQ